MSSVLRCSRTVGLLAVLWVVARCDASQQQPSADLRGDPNGALDRLLTLVSQAVKSATEPLITKLDSQQSQLDTIVSKLDSQQSQLDRQQSRLDAIVNKLDRQQLQLDTIVNKLDSQQSQLDGVTTKLNNQDSRLDSLSSRLDSVNSQLNSRLDSVNSRLDSVNSRLDGLSIRLDRTTTEPSTSSPPPPRDCSDLPAGAQSGIHLVRPGLGRSEPVPAYCDLDTDGGNWTVFQRRADIQPHQDFYLGWQAYKEGFGELDAEFWWGLDHIWAMTSPRDRRYELRVDLEDFDGGKRHAVYQGFRISSEAEGYRLTAVNYTGDAGDSLRVHVGQRFTTNDRDHDIRSDNCAQVCQGAWWYIGCHESNLNGQYLSGKNPGGRCGGISWFGWRGHYSLKTVKMKIRPVLKSG